MKIIGNELWNKATANTDKMVVYMHPILFNLIQGSIDNVALNYCVYINESMNRAKMAVNRSDVDYFKSLIGDEYIAKMHFFESSVSYNPSKNNIFGTTPFRSIKDRKYLSGNTDLMLAVANELVKNNISFSGKVYSNYTSITVNASQYATLRYIKDAIAKKREGFQGKTNLEVVMGQPNKDLSDAVQHRSNERKAFDGEMPDNSISLKDMRDYGYEYTHMLPMREEKALELFDNDLAAVYLLYDDGTEGQAIERDDIINHNGIFGIETDDWSKALDSIEQNRLKAKKLISDFCLREYNSVVDFDNMQSIGIAYTTLTDYELPVQVTVDLVNFKIVYSFDDEIYKTEEYNNINDMIENGLTGLNFDELVSVPTDVQEKHIKEVEFKNDDIVSSMAKAVLAWDEIESIGYRLYEDGYINKYTPHDDSLFGNGLSDAKLFELANRMQDGEDIRKDMSKALLGNQHSFITKHNNEFNVEYGENSVIASYGNAQREISYKELGDAFFKLFKDEYDDIVHNRTVEDDSLTSDVDKDSTTFDAMRQKSEIPEMAHGSFEIYQMKKGEQYHLNRFESLERNKDAGLTMADYNLVYSGDLAGFPADDTLEFIFRKFNVNRPEDFTGHSLSMSDIIVTEIDGEKTAFYCDKVGFTEYPDFFREKEIVQDIALKPTKAESASEKQDLGSVTMRKVGDFYEMYGKNAQIAADVLNLHLTTKNGENMVGFPYYVKGEYADKLRDAGYTVLEEQAFEVNPPKLEEKHENVNKSEQLSLFGDSVPLVAKEKPKHDKDVFDEDLLVGGVNRFTALNDEIMRGTGFEGGKFRVKQFYDDKKPTNKEFADFLKNEYGTGGHSGNGDIFFADHDSKGMFFTLKTGEKFKFTWSEVAEMTSAIIDKGEYITQDDIDRKIRHEKADGEPVKSEKATTIEIGDKFRNKKTGEISEVISLTGALPWITNDCTVQRESNGFTVTENISYAKLFDNNLYEYIGKGEVAEKTENLVLYPTITCEWSENAEFENGKTYSIYEFDSLMKKLDDERVAGTKAAIEKYGSVDAWYDSDVDDEFSRFYGYDKTKFTLNMPDGTKYTERQDIGDGDGGVIDFLSQYDKYNDIIPLLRQAYEEQKSQKLFERNGAQLSGLTNSEGYVESAVDTNAFTINDDTLGNGGAKSKFRANINAINVLKNLELESRAATTDEKEILSKYVGWGAIPQAFEEHNEAWKKEFIELYTVLSPKEYEQARASTLDAFYTSPVIIDGIYQALENFGFKGGNILEPAMGIGNFFGRMPKDLRDNSNLYGVEIDSISGNIAKQLYPNADIKIEGFQNNDYQNGCFDVAVGNVPFGDLDFIDSIHGTRKLHDFFFAETLDKVKDGGIVAFITSTGTLDKKDESVRKLLSEKAELIGAIRLPSGAFKANAGTDVTSDIIFLKKRSKPLQEQTEWVHIGQTDDGLPINNYFAENPDMVLGTTVIDTNPLSSGTKVVPLTDVDLKTAISVAVSKLSATISDVKANAVYPDKPLSEVDIPKELRNHSYFVHDNKVYFKTTNNYAERWEKDVTDNAHERALEYVKLRDCAREVLDAQERNCSDEELVTLQAQLNNAYDSFYKKYGLLHGKGNNAYFHNDISYPLVCSLEKSFEGKKLIEKSELFFKRTISVAKPIDHVDTAREALILSISERACVDLDYMNSVSDIPIDVLIKELNGEIYPVPELSDDNHIVYQEASEYLSGDIRKKLNVAISASELNPVYAQNVTALTDALPEWLKAGDISVKLGAMWIDSKYYQQFMYETFQTPRSCRNDVEHHFWERHFTPVTVKYNEHLGTWHIENKSADKSILATKEYGSHKRNAYQIYEDLLNLKDPKVTKIVIDEKTQKEKRIVDIEATRVVQQKAQKIKEAFKDWVFRDVDRRAELVKKYNDTFNCIRPREYDGSHLTFPGMSTDIKLHGHQKNAIAHALYGGNTLFAHSVGAGKTFEMIATAMESKRLGLCTKSLFAVPNHLTEQIGDDFMRLYPNANIMIATKNDFKKENRQKLISKIATGNFDAIIIGHSQLGMIPISKERQENQINQQIHDIVLGIEQLKRSEGSNFQIKAMERTKKSLTKQLEKLQKNEQDEIVTFEQLGVDRLFVDEAHEFKNLFCATKMQNVAGISSSASQRALDLFMKCQYLDEKTGGKGVVFATGTPISNSVTELHTMMRYLQYDFLSEKGLSFFDSWVSIFGEQKTEYELAPAGNSYRPRTRIANYCNLPELISMFKQCADVKTADVLELDVPECELHIVNAEPSSLQSELVTELSSRADDIQHGNVDPTVDNMLKITSDGRKVGLDPRLIDPSFEDYPESKLNLCVNNVIDIYNDTSEEKLTQIIFCDLGVPHGERAVIKESENAEKEKSVSAEAELFEEKCDFCVYDDIKQKLVSRGVPENEIAFIHSAKTEKAKSDLFEKVRKGQIRVLIGSTGKMGTGTNVQDRLIALHDLDIPWRPADLEQRRGRMVRQGNINKNVHLYRYVTKGTFDAYSYQLLESKQKFISQVITSKSPARVCEDVDQQALSYSEIKSLCTGDERIKEVMTLDNDVKTLLILQKEWQNTQYEMQDFIKNYPTQKEQYEKLIAGIKADIDSCKSLPVDAETKLPAFKITLNDHVFTDKTEAAKQLFTACKQLNNAEEGVEVGKIHGFPIIIGYSHARMCLTATLKGTVLHRVDFTDSFPHNLRKLENLVFTMGKRLEETKNALIKLEVDNCDANKLLSEPFKHADELAQKSERLITLREELNREAALSINKGKSERTFYFERARLKKDMKTQDKNVSEKAVNKMMSVCL